MGDEKVAEAIASMIALYSAMKYFSIMYDRLLVEVKLVQALADPDKSSNLKKCFEVFVKDLDRWYCILKLIGAEIIWEKYKDAWKKVDEKGEGCRENE
jgi:hypothetical protein